MSYKIKKSVSFDTDAKNDTSTLKSHTKSTKDESKIVKFNILTNFIKINKERKEAKELLERSKLAKRWSDLYLFSISDDEDFLDDFYLQHAYAINEKNYVDEDYYEVYLLMLLDRYLYGGGINEYQISKFIVSLESFFNKKYPLNFIKIFAFVANRSDYFYQNDLEATPKVIKSLLNHYIDLMLLAGKIDVMRMMFGSNKNIYIIVFPKFSNESEMLFKNTPFRNPSEFIAKYKLFLEANYVLYVHNLGCSEVYHDAKIDLEVYIPGQLISKDMYLSLLRKLF
jgi:hypothetical protein